MNAEGSPIQHCQKDIAVLPWGPEVIDITEVSQVTKTKNRLPFLYTELK